MYTSTILCGREQRKQIQSLRSCYNNGTANLCKDGCSTAPLVSSFASAPAGPGERSWRIKLIWPPATKGKPLSGKIWTVAPPPVWRGEAHCFVSRQRVEAIWSSIRGAEGGSHAGAPLLKGQEPDSRACGRLAWLKWQIRMRASYIRHLMRAGTCKFTANLQIYFITNSMLNTKLPFTPGGCQRKQIPVQTNKLCLVISFLEFGIALTIEN